MVSGCVLLFRAGRIDLMCPSGAFSAEEVLKLLPFKYHPEDIHGGLLRVAERALGTASSLGK